MTIIFPEDLPDRLACRIEEGLPGRVAHRPMSHELSYGRHAGPAPFFARSAAVLVLLREDAGDWSIPLTLRHHGLGSHAGQISLPGGSIDQGEQESEAALREAEEELGIDPMRLRLLGRLTPIYVYASNFLVAPWVASTDDSSPLRPQPAEVEEVVEMPLVDLAGSCSVGSHEINRGTLRFSAPHYNVAGHRVWGATALILAEVAAILADLDPHPRSAMRGR